MVSLYTKLNAGAHKFFGEKGKAQSKLLPLFNNYTERVVLSHTRLTRRTNAKLDSNRSVQHQVPSESGRVTWYSLHGISPGGNSLGWFFINVEHQWHIVSGPVRTKEELDIIYINNRPSNSQFATTTL